MEQKITFYEELNAKQRTKIRENAERIKEIQDELVKIAYDEGLVDGYIQARQHLEEEEREKFRKADEELVEFWVDTIIIAVIGVAVATIIAGVSYL